LVPDGAGHDRSTRRSPRRPHKEDEPLPGCQRRPLYSPRPGRCSHGLWRGCRLWRRLPLHDEARRDIRQRSRLQHTSHRAGHYGLCHWRRRRGYASRRRDSICRLRL
ncbi:hypothetical protein BN1723_020444, partial [Verticillium longisporum]